MDAPGNISWAITATALVLLMTPGVAFFYGGLVKAKSVVSMMMMSFGSIGLVAVLWILYGFSMSAVDSPTAFAGNPFADFGLSSLASGEGSNVALLGVAYGATFAIITVALISGAIADRAKFGSWLIFAGIFATVGYFPVAAWVWGGGWIMNLAAFCLSTDTEEAAYQAAAAAIEAIGGKGTIVHMTGNNVDSNTQRRIEGVKRAIDETDGAVTLLQTITDVDTDLATAQKAASDLLAASGSEISAIVTTAYNPAVASAEAIAESGLDIQLIAIDNVETYGDEQSAFADKVKKQFEDELLSCK
jgi:hypothetical protein